MLAAGITDAAWTVTEPVATSVMQIRQKA